MGRLAAVTPVAGVERVGRRRRPRPALVRHVLVGRARVAHVVVLVVRILPVAYGLWCAVRRHSSATRLCGASGTGSVSYTHLRAHETLMNL
eukprot:7391243-Prymnesium_polylepis.1